MKWIVKREPVKSESKQKPKEAIELKHIRKTRQLKLRKPIIREPIIVTNPLRPRPPRAGHLPRPEPGGQAAVWLGG